MKEYKSVIEDLFNGNVMIEDMLELQGEDAEHLRSVQVEIDKKLRDKFSQNSVKIASGHDFEKTLDKFENIYKKVIADKK